MTTHWHEKETRELHEKDIITRSDKNLQEELSEAIIGETLVVGGIDGNESVKPLLPKTNGQQELPIPNEERLDFGSNTTFCIEPIGKRGGPSDPDHPDTFLPYRKTQRFHFDSNEFETVVLLLGKCWPFFRDALFHELTRICREGGKIITIPGLRPKEDPNYDASYFVPNSDDVALEEIRLLRTEDCKTPIVMSTFITGASKERYPDAEIVTESDIKP